MGNLGLTFSIAAIATPSRKILNECKRAESWALQMPMLANLGALADAWHVMKCKRCRWAFDFPSVQEANIINKPSF